MGIFETIELDKCLVCVLKAFMNEISKRRQIKDVAELTTIKNGILLSILLATKNIDHL